MCVQLSSAPLWCVMLVMFEREEIGRETMGEERGETGARYDGGLAVTCSSYYVVILPSSHIILWYQYYTLPTHKLRNMLLRAELFYFLTILCTEWVEIFQSLVTWSLSVGSLLKQIRYDEKMILDFNNFRQMSRLIFYVQLNFHKVHWFQFLFCLDSESISLMMLVMLISLTSYCLIG